MPSWNDYKTPAMPTSGAGNPILTPVIFDALVSAIAAWPAAVNANNQGLFALSQLQIKPAALPTGLTAGDAGLIALDLSYVLQIWTGSAWVVIANLGSSLPAQGGNAGKYLTTNGSAMSWSDVIKLAGRAVHTAAPTDGQALVWDNANSRWAPATVASAPSGAAGGDLAGTYPNPALGPSGVSAGTYGSATQVPRVTLDAKGRVTAVSELTIAGAIANYSVGFTSATSVTILGSAHAFGTDRLFVVCYDSSTPRQQFTPSSVTVHPTTFDVVVDFGGIALSGRVFINGVGGSGPSAGTPNFEVAFTSATTVTVAAAAHGFATSALQVVAYDNSTPREAISPTRVAVHPSTFEVTVDFAVAATGTLVINGTGGSGAGGNATALRGKTISTTAPTAGQSLVYDLGADQYVPASPAAPLPTQSGNAGKVLRTDGTVAAWSDVLQLAGRTVHTAAPTDGQVLRWDNANSRWAPATPSAGGSSIPYVVAAFQLIGGVFGALAAPTGYSAVVDLNNATQFRLVSNCVIPGAVTQSIEIQAYDGAAFHVLASNPASSTGLKDSGWQTIPSGCRIVSIALSLYIRNGNGATSFSAQNLNLYAK
jgi:hypothetical protein